MSGRGGDRFVSAGLTLRELLPATRALALSGGLGWEKVLVLTDAVAVAGLDAEQAGRVEARVLARAAVRSVGQHAAAVRRAVAAVDPDGLAGSRRRDRDEIELIRAHIGGAMGELFARLPSEQADLVWLAADTWARARKADGDTRTLPQLRVAALVTWAKDYLTRARPHRHGRAVRLVLSWHLDSLLGLNQHGGELFDSAEPLPATVMRELVSGGAYLRRMIINPSSGELIDLTPTSLTLPATSQSQTSGPTTSPTSGETSAREGASAPLLAPIELRVIVDDKTWQALRVSDPAVIEYLDALAALPDTVRRVLCALIDAPLTADTLDAQPDRDRPSAALGEWVATRYRHPANPGAGASPASAGDLDHITPRSKGGKTTRNNLHPPARRWHQMRTHSGWRLTIHQPGHITWISPRGRRYTIHPYDYRRDP
jgi:hypothetical protein